MRMHRSSLSLALAITLLLGTAASCRAQYSALPRTVDGGPVSWMSDDAHVAASFRMLLDELIGDSADRICVSITDRGAASPHTPDDAIDRDPSEETLRRLRGTRVIVMARSVCAADERNFGPSRGHIRLRDIAEAADGTLTIDAEAMGHYFARYQCVGRYGEARIREARCRITSRD